MSSSDQRSTNGQPSLAAIDHVQRAKQTPRYAVLDDINVDLITVLTLGFTVFSILILRTSYLRAILTAVTIIIPLRRFFPVATKPIGLALITGASSGIGAELAYIFTKNGSDVILVGRNEEQLNAVKKNIESAYPGRTAFTAVCDLSVPGAAKALYDSVVGKSKVVDILVNNAGLGHAGDVMEQGEDLSERMIALNCTALVQLTQLFGKDMVARGRGWILQTSSIVGFMVGPGQNLYHASKHFVRAFNEALSIELRGTNVSLTQLMPGPVRTQFATRAQLERTFTFSSSGSVEDPKAVAQAGYQGLCKNKRMVFSSWSAAFMATSMHLMPRSLHVTIGRLMNTPTSNTEMNGPLKKQELNTVDPAPDANI